MNQEIWKVVAGYEGLYEVSNQGRVRNRFARILKPGQSGRYLTCGLCKNGKQTTNSVHRLVAVAFLPNPQHLPVVRHLNDDPQHCAASNLAWGTTQDNSDDAQRNGIRIGSPGKLSDDDVYCIKIMLDETRQANRRRARGTLQHIANSFGVTVNLIWSIDAGRSHA